MMVRPMMVGLIVASFLSALVVFRAPITFHPGTLRSVHGNFADHGLVIKDHKTVPIVDSGQSWAPPAAVYFPPGMIMDAQIIMDDEHNMQDGHEFRHRDGEVDTQPKTHDSDRNGVEQNEFTQFPVSHREVPAHDVTSSDIKMSKDKPDRLAMEKAELKSLNKEDSIRGISHVTRDEPTLPQHDPSFDWLSKVGPKGSMYCNGKLTHSEIIYWRDVFSTPEYVNVPPVSVLAPRSHMTEERFITFEYDHGGWNNIRIGVECFIVAAHALGRTLVLPPSQSLYLVGQKYDDRRDFGLSDFLNVTLLKSHKGWRVIDMTEFLRIQQQVPEHTAKSPSSLNLKKNELWHYLEKAADMVPNMAKGFLALPGPQSLDGHGTEDYVHFVSDPTNGTRTTEERFKAFPKKDAIFYDKKFQKARHIHMRGRDRMLTQHYAWAFFGHPKLSSFYRRFVRDYARYRDEIQCAAAEVVSALRAQALKRSNGTDGTFYALHVRRNDFQYRQAKIGAPQIVENLNGNELIPRGALVYIATDDPDGVCKGCMFNKKSCSSYAVPRPKGSGCPDDPSWDAFRRNGWEIAFLRDFSRDSTSISNLNPNYFGHVDVIVCSVAKVFAGTFWSTFTGYIHRLRGYHGLGEDSYYHTPGKLMEMRAKKRNSGGWMREYRAGWTDDEYGNQI